MNSIFSTHPHVEFVGNFYQRRMNSSNICNEASANIKDGFDEKSFMESGTLTGLLRSILTSILTLNSQHFSAFVNGFDNADNAANFKNALKEGVTDESIRRDIDNLTAEKLTELRDLIHALEANASEITERFTDEDERDLYHSSLYFQTNAFHIKVEGGVLRVGANKHNSEIIFTKRQFLSGRKNLEWISLSKNDMSDINFNGANLMNSRINKTDLTNGDLRNADFRYARVIDSNLTNIKIAWANFYGADFARVKDSFTLDIDDFDDLEGTLKAIRSIDNVGPAKSNHCDIKNSLMEQIIHRFNELTSAHIGRESRHTSSLRAQILSAVTNRIYDENQVINEFKIESAEKVKVLW